MSSYIQTRTEVIWLNEFEVPARILFREMLRGFAMIYSYQGISLGRSFRSRCVDSILSLLSSPKLELIRFIDEVFADTNLYEKMQRLSEIAVQNKNEQQSICCESPIGLARNDWLIAELLWYWLDWYRKDRESHPHIFEQLTEEERWAEVVVTLHPIRAEQPQFSIDDILTESRNRKSFAQQKEFESTKPATE